MIRRGEYVRNRLLARIVGLVCLGMVDIGWGQSGYISTIAGSGIAGFMDGMGVSARLYGPAGIAIDGAGCIYVAERENHVIRKIDPSGMVSTVAGSGAAGYMNGIGATAQFYHPRDVIVDASGNLYVADPFNHRIRKIDPSGMVSTVAGSGVAGFLDGPGVTARFNMPYGIAMDGAGYLYVADLYNHRIRKIDPSGMVSTVAGSGVAGFVNGTAISARFNSPLDLTMDNAGNLIVDDKGNHAIRKIDPSGVVSTIAGTGVPGFADGQGSSAQFDNPGGRGVTIIGTESSIRRPNQGHMPFFLEENDLSEVICPN